MDNEDLVTVELRLETPLADWIRWKAEQCGLTPDQFASALTVIALDRYIALTPPLPPQDAPSNRSDGEDSP